MKKPKLLSEDTAKRIEHLLARGYSLPDIARYTRLSLEQIKNFLLWV